MGIGGQLGPGNRAGDGSCGSDESGSVKGITNNPHYLSNIGHELRTPLNAILGMSSLLGDSVLDEVQRGQLEAIATSGERLLQLTDSIMEFWRLQSGVIDWNPHAFYLEKLVVDTLKPYKVQAEKKGVLFSWDIEQSLAPRLEGDARRIGMILGILASNAVRFTDGGRIHVDVLPGRPVAGEPQLEFKVKDTGSGISSEQLEQIYEPFFQADTSLTRVRGGLGLGLALAKGWAEVMGGRIQVASELGCGSEFSLYLPYRVVADEIEEEIHFLKERKREEPGEGRRILLAEDNLMNQEVAVLLLAKLGYQAEVVSNGLEVIDALMTQDYDVLLIDLHMPVLDGWQTIQRIRNEFPLEMQPRIVALSGDEAARERNSTERLGADAILAKPIRLSALSKVLKNSTELVEH